MAVVRNLFFNFLLIIFISIFALYLITYELTLVITSTFYSSDTPQSQNLQENEYQQEYYKALDKLDEDEELLQRPQLEKKDWFTSLSESNKKSEDVLNKYRVRVVNYERDRVKAEMKDFEPTDTKIKLNDLIMETGGQPIRSMIFASYRTGSTFVGDILQHHPGTFYHFEPFIYLGHFIQIRTGALAKEAVRAAKELFNCRYNTLSALIFSSKTHISVHSHNARLWEFCKRNQAVCWNSQFLSNMCKLFPIQTLKTVRLRLKFANAFMEDPSLNLKTILLIRDPRGIIQSRSNLNWCENTDCVNPNALCSDMVDDYHKAEILYSKYPERFMALRYEDISMNPISATKKLYNFFGLKYSMEIENFVYNHTTQDDDRNDWLKLYSTFRNSKETPFHWKMDFAHNFTAVQNIQMSCSKAMQLWGYATVKNENELMHFNPLDKPPWQDMNISPDNSVRKYRA